MSARLCESCFQPVEIPPGDACPHCGWTAGQLISGPQLDVGTPLANGKYVIGRCLGQGGFGITYLCWDANLNVTVAVKEYYPQQLGSRTIGMTTVNAFPSKADDYTYGLNQFLSEARTLARYRDHPGIVSILDFFAENGSGYMVMEHLSGCTLDSKLAHNQGRIEPPLAIAILERVMDALRVVHADGLIHRDISPDNIFLLNDGRVKVIDFGAARQMVSGRSKALSVILKEGYAPFEQYQSNGSQGPWTDVYAVAATFYRSTTGQMPPSATDRVMNDQIIPPSALGVAIAPAVEAVMMKAMAVNAENRYPDMGQLLAALHAARDGNGDENPPKNPTKPDTDISRIIEVPEPPKASNAVLKLAIAASLAAVLGGAAFMMLPKQTTTPTVDASTMGASEVGRKVEHGANPRSLPSTALPATPVSTDVDHRAVQRNLATSARLLNDAAKMQMILNTTINSAERMKAIADTPELRTSLDRDQARIRRQNDEVSGLVGEYRLAVQALAAIPGPGLDEVLETEMAKTSSGELVRQALPQVVRHAKTAATRPLSESEIREDVKRLAQQLAALR